MVETALLVAVIGIAGTLSASILTVLSEPWRKNKERKIKKESIRKALYSELAHIAVYLNEALVQARAVENNTLSPLRTGGSVTLSQISPSRGSVSQIVTPISQGQVIELEPVEGTDFNKSQKMRRASLLYTLNYMFDFKGSVYTLIKSDPELAVLFYELPEAYVMDVVHKAMDKYAQAKSIPKDPTDPKAKWVETVTYLEGLRRVFLESKKNGSLNVAMLKTSCALPSSKECIDWVLNESAS